MVTVRGRDLGLGRDDVVGLYICGSSVVDSVRYISSERLVCTTSAWRPCVGCVTVETASGGRASSTAQFTFLAASEPPAPRVAVPRSTLLLTAEPPKQRRRRFSVGSLENVRPEPPPAMVGKVVLRRRKSVEASASAAAARCAPATEAVQPAAGTWCDVLVRPARRLPHVDDRSPRQSDDKQVATLQPLSFAHQQEHAGSKTLHRQTPPVLNWRCRFRLQHRSPSQCSRSNLFLDDCKSANTELLQD